MESGGQNTNRQMGDVYVLRCSLASYLAPAIHDKLITTNYGTLEVKQISPEGDYYVLRCLGKVTNRAEG